MPHAQGSGVCGEGVYSGRAALAFVGSGRPYDLFILDIRLSDISGLELARAITALAAPVPVLFISGYPEVGGERLPDSP